MSQQHDGRSVYARRIAVASVCCFIALVAAACGTGATSVSDLATVTFSPAPSATGTPAPSATATATAASVRDCSSINGDPIHLIVPLPPNTISHNIGGGTAGATFYIECTPNMSQAALVASLNAGFQQAGWKPWDPTVDDAGGCGTQANDFWQWKNGDVATGWTFRGAPLPEWMIAFCSLAYATPQA